MTRPISETELQLNLARALYAARPELVWQNGEARALPFDLSREGARLSIDQARAVIRLLKDYWEAIMAGGMLGIEAMEKAGVTLSGVRITEAHLDTFESVIKLPGDDPGGYESRYQSSGADLTGFALQDARPVSITRHANLTPDGYFAGGRKLEPRPIENLTGDVANLNSADDQPFLKVVSKCVDEAGNGSVTVEITGRFRPGQRILSARLEGLVGEVSNLQAEPPAEEEPRS